MTARRIRGRFSPEDKDKGVAAIADLNDVKDRIRAREADHEKALGHGMYTVARLDGRAFTALSEVRKLEKPFNIERANPSGCW